MLLAMFDITRLKAPKNEQVTRIAHPWGELWIPVRSGNGHRAWVSVLTDQREPFQFPTQYTISCAYLEMKQPLISRLYSYSLLALELPIDLRWMTWNKQHGLVSRSFEGNILWRWFRRGWHRVLLNFPSLTPLGFPGVKSWLHKAALDLDLSGCQVNAFLGPQNQPVAILILNSECNKFLGFWETQWWVDWYNSIIKLRAESPKMETSRWKVN